MHHPGHVTKTQHVGHSECRSRQEMLHGEHFSFAARLNPHARQSSRSQPVSSLEMLSVVERWTQSMNREAVEYVTVEGDEQEEFGIK